LGIERKALDAVKSMKAALLEDLLSGRIPVPTSTQEAA